MWFHGRALLSGLVNLVTLDMGVGDHELPKLGIKSLETLLLDHIGRSIRHVNSSGILIGLPSLKRLDLNDNLYFPGYVLKSLLEPVCGSLEYLDLAFTSNDGLATETFTNCSKLGFLKLAGNRIPYIQRTDFVNNVNLQYLNLSHNRITNIEDDSFRNLRALKQLSLDGNRFQCDCALRGFQEWLKAQNKSVVPRRSMLEKCHSPLDMKGLKVTDYSMPWIACDNHSTYVILAACFVFVLMLVLIFWVLYKYRYDLVFWWVIRMGRGSAYQRIEDGQDFDFNAFLSYSNADGDLAVAIHKHLETGLDRSCRIAIDGRDFVPGEYLTENICNLISRSSRVLFLISRSFLEGKWTTYELRMGEFRSFEARRNLMILIFIEDIPDQDLPRTLRTLKRNVNYLVYPPEWDRRATDVFWKRLQLGLSKRE